MMAAVRGEMTFSIVSAVTFPVRMSTSGKMGNRALRHDARHRTEVGNGIHNDFFTRPDVHPQ